MICADKRPNYTSTYQNLNACLAKCLNKIFMLKALLAGQCENFAKVYGLWCGPGIGVIYHLQLAGCLLLVTRLIIVLEKYCNML